MGYDALGNGTITIPKADQEDCFLAAMTTLFDAPVGSEEENADNLTELLECVFEDLTTEGDTFYVSYNARYGEHWMFRFLQSFAPFVTEGVIDWSSNSNSLWRHRFHDGEVVAVEAQVTYVGDPRST